MAIASSDVNFEFSEIFFLELARPNYQNSPSKLMQLFSHIRIMAHIAVELRLPEFRITRWSCGKATVFMPVPETAMYKYHNSVLR